MRKAATKLVAAGLFAVLSSTLVRGAAFDEAGSIAHARRLIEANDHAAAAAVLEDALIDAETKDRPAIVQLLRQSYAVMAKEAEAAGRKREAAHYRDNLAILNRNQEPAVRPAEPGKRPEASAPAKTPIAPERPSDAPAAAPAPAPVPLQPSTPVQPKNDEALGSHRASAVTDKTLPDRKVATPLPAERAESVPMPAPPAPISGRRALAVALGQCAREHGHR